MHFNQRHILITGATGGIGSALARALASEGATLLLHGRNHAALEELADTCRQRGAAGVVTCAVDLADAAGRARLLRCVQEEFSGLDTLINNAGISRFELFGHQSPALIETLISTNITAPVLLTRQLLGTLQRSACETPVILNIGSAFGAIGFPGYTTYCASKGALRMFSEALARELADTPLRVQYLAPRATRTAINSSRAGEMLAATGTRSDPPERVALAALKLLRSGRAQAAIGWPERLLVRLNGLRPELLSTVLRMQLGKIKPFATPDETGV